MWVFCSIIRTWTPRRWLIREKSQRLNSDTSLALLILSPFEGRVVYLTSFCPFVQAQYLRRVYARPDIVGTMMILASILRNTFIQIFNCPSCNRFHQQDVDTRATEWIRSCADHYPPLAIVPNTPKILPILFFVSLFPLTFLKPK